MNDCRSEIQKLRPDDEVHLWMCNKHSVKCEILMSFDLLGKIQLFYAQKCNKKRPAISPRTISTLTRSIGLTTGSSVCHQSCESHALIYYPAQVSSACCDDLSAAFKKTLKIFNKNLKQQRSQSHQHHQDSTDQIQTEAVKLSLSPSLCFKHQYIITTPSSSARAAA